MDALRIVVFALLCTGIGAETEIQRKGTIALRTVIETLKWISGWAGDYTGDKRASDLAVKYSNFRYDDHIESEVAIKEIEGLKIVYILTETVLTEGDVAEFVSKQRTLDNLKEKNADTKDAKDRFINSTQLTGYSFTSTHLKKKLKINGITYVGYGTFCFTFAKTTNKTDLEWFKKQGVKTDIRTYDNLQLWADEVASISANYEEGFVSVYRTLENVWFKIPDKCTRKQAVDILQAFKAKLGSNKDAVIFKFAWVCNGEYKYKKHNNPNKLEFEESKKGEGSLAILSYLPPELEAVEQVCLLKSMHELFKTRIVKYYNEKTGKEMDETKNEKLIGHVRVDTGAPQKMTELSSPVEYRTITLSFENEFNAYQAFRRAFVGKKFLEFASRITHVWIVRKSDGGLVSDKVNTLYTFNFIIEPITVPPPSKNDKPDPVPTNSTGVQNTAGTPTRTPTSPKLQTALPGKDSQLQSETPGASNSSPTFVTQSGSTPPIGRQVDRQTNAVPQPPNNDKPNPVTTNRTGEKNNSGPDTSGSNSISPVVTKGGDNKSKTGKENEIAPAKEREIEIGKQRLQEKGASSALELNAAGRPAWTPTRTLTSPKLQPPPPAVQNPEPQSATPGASNSSPTFVTQSGSPQIGRRGDQQTSDTPITPAPISPTKPTRQRPQNIRNIPPIQSHQISQTPAVNEGSNNTSHADMLSRPERPINRTLPRAPASNPVEKEQEIRVTPTPLKMEVANVPKKSLPTSIPPTLPTSTGGKGNNTADRNINGTVGANDTNTGGGDVKNITVAAGTPSKLEPNTPLDPVAHISKGTPDVIPPGLPSLTQTRPMQDTRPLPQNKQAETDIGKNNNRRQIMVAKSAQPIPDPRALPQTVAVIPVSPEVQKGSEKPVPTTPEETKVIEVPSEPSSVSPTFPTSAGDNNASRNTDSVAGGNDKKATGGDATTIAKGNPDTQNTNAAGEPRIMLGRARLNQSATPSTSTISNPQTDLPQPAGKLPYLDELREICEKRKCTQEASNGKQSPILPTPSVSPTQNNANADSGTHSVDQDNVIKDSKASGPTSPTPTLPTVVDKNKDNAGAETTHPTTPVVSSLIAPQQPPPISPPISPPLPGTSPREAQTPQRAVSSKSQQQPVVSDLPQPMVPLPSGLPLPPPTHTDHSQSPPSKVSSQQKDKNVKGTKAPSSNSGAVGGGAYYQRPGRCSCSWKPRLRDCAPEQNEEIIEHIRSYFPANPDFEQLQATKEAELWFARNAKAVDSMKTMKKPEIENEKCYKWVIKFPIQGGEVTVTDILDVEANDKFLSAKLCARDDIKVDDVGFKLIVWPGGHGGPMQTGLILIVMWEATDSHVMKEFYQYFPQVYSNEVSCEVANKMADTRLSEIDINTVKQQREVEFEKRTFITVIIFPLQIGKASAGDVVIKYGETFKQNGTAFPLAAAGYAEKHVMNNDLVVSTLLVMVAVIREKIPYNIFHLSQLRLNAVATIEVKKYLDDLEFWEGDGTARSKKPDERLAEASFSILNFRLGDDGYRKRIVKFLREARSPKHRISIAIHLKKPSDEKKGLYTIYLIKCTSDKSDSKVYAKPLRGRK